MMRINVSIARFVLDGPPVSSSQGEAIRSAIERELTGLVIDRGLGWRLVGGGIASVKTDALKVGDQSVQDVAKRVADALYTGIKCVTSGSPTGQFARPETRR